MFKKGDIFFTDSDKTGPKIVKFLMQSPTFWHWGIGKAVGLFSKDLKAKFISPVRMYHAGMLVSEDTLIEQQGKVEYSEASGILGKKHVVWRHKHLTEEQANDLVKLAESRLGTKYDVQAICLIMRYLVIQGGRLKQRMNIFHGLSRIVRVKA